MILLKNLFDFNKPKFLKLDYIDIVVENKILFLVSWKSKSHNKIKIPRFRRTYHNHETAVILKLPPHTDELTITLHSLWRKRRYKILLKKIKLDKETSLHLITQFRPVEMLRLKTPVVNSLWIFRDTNIPVLSVKIATSLLIQHLSSSIQTS